MSNWIDLTVAIIGLIVTLIWAGTALYFFKVSEHVIALLNAILPALLKRI